MFGIILNTIIAVFHIYIFYRITSISFFTRKISKKIWIFIGVFSWMFFVFIREFFRLETGLVFTIAENIGMSIMGSSFIIFTVIFLTDLITLFGYLFSSKKQTIRLIALCVGIFLSIFAHIQALRLPEVVEYKIKIKNLDKKLENTKIVAIADTHIGREINNTKVSNIVSLVMEQNPDIILLLGDIFEGKYKITKQVKKQLSKLSAKYGVWGVIGNHDDRKRYDNKYPLEHTNVKLLYNEHKKIAPNLFVAGTQDFGWDKKQGDFVEKTLKEIPTNKTTIYLSHAPLEYNKASNLGVDLMLSGHTHAGQIWPFEYLVKLSYPLYKGKYTINDMTLIVSRGAGTWGPKMRLFKRGEISKIILTRK